MNYTFQFGVIFDRLPELLGASLLTLELAFVGFWLGMPIALLLATMRTSGSRLARGVSGTWVTFLTNTPVLIHIYFLYYGLPELGIVLDKHVAVIIGLITATSAYGCEILRAGFASVNYRHIEAFMVAAGIYVVITFAATLSLALIGRWVFHVKARIF